MNLFSTLARRLIYSLFFFVATAVVALIVIRFVIMRPVTCMPDCTSMNLAGRDLSRADLVGARFIEANLERVDLSNANLSEADLSGANLSDADLRNADLRNAKLIGANLARTNLGGSLLAGADLGGANLEAADLTAVDLTETLLSGARFVGAKLTDVRLAAANLAGIEFAEATLAGIDLQRANLSGANLSQADLSGARLAGADLTGAWLNLANLTGADLANADLTGSSLIGSQLTSANLSGGILRGAILVGANVDGANVRGADLAEIQTEPAQLSERDLQLDPVLEELNELQLSAILITASLSGVETDSQTRWTASLAPRTAATSSAGVDASQNLTGTTDTALAAFTTDGSTARRVKVNFFINAIRAINSETGSYEIDFFLDFHWLEAELGDQDVSLLDPDLLWNPEIEVINSQNTRLVSQRYQNSLEPGANVRLSQRLVGEFFTPFDLTAFPFDQQTFSIQVESAEFDSEALLFDFVHLLQPVAHTEIAYVQEAPRGRYVAANVADNTWRANRVQIAQLVRVLPYDKSSWSQFRIDVQMARNATPYFWKYMLALTLVMLLVWGALLIKGEILHVRLWMLFLLLLVTVALHALMVRTLPQTHQLTFLDRYLLICYGAIGFTVLIAVVIKTLYHWRPTGLVPRLDRAIALAYPLILISLNVILFWSTMG